MKKLAVHGVAIIGAIVLTATDALPLAMLYLLVVCFAVFAWLMNANPYTTGFREFLIFLQGGLPWGLAAGVVSMALIMLLPVMFGRWMAVIHRNYLKSFDEALRLIAGAPQQQTKKNGGK